ncbi:MAG TPA: hypothetical protein VM344_04245, partial [Vitreimonas sp.]|nr:hypothetical protein [Vitreimonas sp.]
AGTAPAGFVVRDPDLILTVGAAVASELYGVEVPIVSLRPESLARLHSGMQLTISPGGHLSVGHPSGPR